VVQVESLEAVVGADAVAGGLGAETRAFGGLVGMEAAVLIRGLDEGVVLGLGDDVEKFGHGIRVS
jgi:hypothetical protein